MKMGYLKNTRDHYSLVAQLFHWITVPVVVMLFGLGFWMVDLGYYDAWYQKAPRLHTGWGSLLGFFIMIRLIYRACFRYPQPLSSHKPVEQRLGRLMHFSLYGIMVGVIISGYIMVTVKGDPLPVFDWFELPPLFQSERNLQDQAGRIHEILAYLLMVFVAVHGLAAVKHHFIDRDATLKRMAGRKR